MGLNDFDIFQKVAAPLAGPRPVSSWLELARRGRVPDDKAKRTVERLEAYFRTQLIAVSEGHRLTLTNAGRTFLRLVGQLTSLADQEDVPTETITVQADPDVITAILPAALPPFFDAWGGLIQLRIGPLDGSVRKNIADGLTSFAIDLAEDGETVPAAEAPGRSCLGSCWSRSRTRSANCKAPSPANRSAFTAGFSCPAWRRRTPRWALSWRACLLPAASSARRFTKWSRPASESASPSTCMGIRTAPG